jgi:hypothetical protein
MFRLLKYVPVVVSIIGVIRTSRKQYAAGATPGKGRARRR